MENLAHADKENMYQVALKKVYKFEIKNLYSANRAINKVGVIC